MRIIKEIPSLLIVKIGDAILPTIVGGASVLAGLSMILSPQSFSDRSGDLTAAWVGLAFSVIGVFALANARTITLSFDKNNNRLIVEWKNTFVLRRSKVFLIPDVKNIGLREEEAGNFSSWKCTIGFRNGEELSFRIGLARPEWRRDRLLLGDISRTICQRMAAFIQVRFEDGSVTK